MSDFLPPVMVELAGSDDGFIKTLTRATTALERFAEAARVSAAAVEGSFAQLGAAFESLAPAIESVTVAKKEMQGFARASNSVARATDKAAAATEAAMSSIAASAERMGEAVSTAAAEAETGIVAIGTEAKATAAGLKVTGDEAVVAGTKMKTSGAEAEVMGGKFLGLGPVFDKVKKWGALGLAGIGIASVDLASKFQAEMTRLSTAAGAPVKQVNAMKGAVLATANAVGMSGTKMAEALYHPISAGLDLKTSLAAVKYAAEEAQISGANLEDTTYSLSSVMKAFNQPASQAQSTMASLNAIVGQGDMRFQDFNESIKNWAPTAAQMGISVNSMGAGLAYLTDRGNSAEVAATRMTMGISMMTTPSAKATAMLKGLGLASTDVSASSAAMKQAMEKAGITQNKLAADLKQPDGLYVALNDLKTSLEKAGVSGTEADSVLSKIFGGGRSDKAIMSLMQNLDGLKTKFGDIQKAANTKNFDTAWQRTQQTFSVQMSKLKSAAANAGISIGTVLLPAVTSLVHGLAAVLGPIASFVGSHQKLVGLVASLAGGLLVGAAALKTWAIAQSAVNALMLVFDAEADANPIGAIVMAIAALVAGLIYAYTHFATFRAIVNDVGRFLGSTFKAAWHGAELVVHGLVIAWDIAAAGMRVAWSGIVAGATWLWHAVTGVWHAIVSVTTTVWNGITAFFRKWWPLLLVVFATPIALLIGLWNRTHTALAATARAVWNNLATFFSAIWSAIKATASVVWSLVQAAVINPMISVGQQLRSLWDTVKGWLSAAWSGIRSVASSLWGLIKAAMVNPMSAAVKAIYSYMTQVGTAINSRLSAAWSTAKSWGSRFISIGSSIVHGIVSGVEGAAGSLFGSLKSLASSALSAAKSVLGINSPSRLFADHVGRGVAEGIAKGVDDNAVLAHASVRNVAEGMVKEASAALGIASPSKVFRTLGIYLNEGLIDGLTGSTARVKAATRRIESLLQETYNRVADLRGTKGVSNKWVASHEATLRHLETYARKEDNLMKSLAAKRDSVATRIKAAQKALATVQKEWSAEVKTVADGVMQGFSIITQAPQDGFALSAADVVNNMQAQYQKAQQFAAELQTLQKRGLSSTLIQQIASAGVDQGGATAAALAGASTGQIKQLNQLQSATQSAANGVGVAVADSMYGAGLKSAQGLVKGLQSQEKAIEKQMLKIAKAMQKAIKQALGIHSPSRVFEEIATWIPKGLAKGVDGSAHHATDAVNRLAGSVAGAGRFAGAGLAMAGGGGATVVNNYTVNVTVEGQVLTERKLQRVVEEQMLRVGMRNPGTYPPYKR